MGFVASVFVAQHIAGVLNRSYLGNVISLNYIDNIFGGAPTQEEAWMRIGEIEALSLNLSLDIKDKSQECAQSLDILGIQVDAHNKTICLANKFIDNHLLQLRDLASGLPMVMFARECMVLVGILIRVVYVFRIPFYDVPHAIKKGHSPHADINLAVRFYHQFEIHGLFIRSHLNPADPLSRDGEIFGGDLLASHGYLCAPMSF